MQARSTLDQEAWKVMSLMVVAVMVVYVTQLQVRAVSGQMEMRSTRMQVSQVGEWEGKDMIISMGCLRML